MPPFRRLGNLVFFDAEERRIPNSFHPLVRIPKLSSEWKIMFDVQPTEHLQVEDPRKLYLSLYIEVGHVTSVNAIVSPPNITLLHTFDDQGRNVVTGDQVPKVGEWTRIEIGHEDEDGKYFLSLAVGGEHVGRGEVTDPVLKNPTDVMLFIGNPHPLPGFVRRVLVLQK